MAFAAVTIFTILLYVPPFKAGVLRVRSAIVGAVRGIWPRRA
jgi:putative tricarboxylic transport membrane protein